MSTAAPKPSRFPILQGLVTAGDVTFLGDQYIGHVSDGTVVLIGTVGREKFAELYLAEHPTPDTW